MSGWDGVDALMESAQRAAGVLAARRRGDEDGVAALMRGFDGADDLAGGALLLAQLSLDGYARETGRTFEECASDISLTLGAGAER